MPVGSVRIRVARPACMCLAREKPSPKPSALRLPPNKIIKECVAASSAVPAFAGTSLEMAIQATLGETRILLCRLRQSHPLCFRLLRGVYP
jgi:hypothetical protein